MNNFATFNLSDIISTLGVGLTVFFAWQAKSAAKAAEQAADRTRLRLGKLEAIDLIKDCLSLAETTIEKIEQESWDLVSYNSSAVRKSLVSLQHNANGVIDSKHESIIKNGTMQFRILTEKSDKIRMTAGTTINKPLLISNVNFQIDGFIEIREHIRRQLGQQP